MSTSRRHFTVAYRAVNGNVIPVGTETVVSEHLIEVLNEWQKDDQNEYFIAYRDVPAWEDVADEDASGMVTTP